MNEDTRETVVEYALRRAATISTEIDYEDSPELGSEIYVMDARPCLKNKSCTKEADMRN